MSQENAQLLAVFAGRGVTHFESEQIQPTTNEDVVRELEAECAGVEFQVRDLTRGDAKLDAVIAEAQGQKDKLDGLLIFGGLEDYRLALTGLPTIAVYNFPGFSHFPYKLFCERSGIVTATLDRANVCDPARSAAMFDDLVGKIRLLRALATMKRARMLVITDRPYVDVQHGDRGMTYPGDLRQKPPEEFNEIFTAAVRESFGTEVVKIGSEQVASNERIQRIEPEQAQEIANRWMADAREMRGTTEREVINSARMYLAMKILTEEHDATVIATHIRSLKSNPQPEEMAWPSMGNSQLQLDGLVGCCQGHVNVVLTHMLAQYAFGRPSMMGDFMVDVANEVGIVMHCGAPWNPWGGERRVPYIIRDHAERRVSGHSQPGCGASSEVLYPAGEPATVWRVDVPSKSILVHTGTTVDGYALYKDLTNIMCRSKLVVEVDDARKVQSHLYPDMYGVHRTGTLGDFREQIKDIGALIGFEVIEEDR